jgi:hypothetical protein
VSLPTLAAAQGVVPTVNVSVIQSFSAIAPASIQRPANTTTYTANTGWNNATASASGTFSFTNVCRVAGGQVLIPQIDVYSSANPTTKLTGIVYLFATPPATLVSDNATFTLTSTDFANLTGSILGVPFTLANTMAAGATNSGTSMVGTSYHAQCPPGTTTITGAVQVTNAYAPVSGETLTIRLHTVGLN